MINKLKQMLLENPENIAALLSAYDFEKISIRNNELRFAHDSDGGANNVSIRTDQDRNSYLNVADYSHGIYTDIFSYIIQECGVTFKDVLTTTKNILGLDEHWTAPSKCRPLFGGIYQRIINKTSPEPKVYPEEILKQYVPIGNELWLKDGISLEVQREFDVCFSPEDNAIIFPWKDAKDDIIAIKSRYNGTPPEGMSKYFYPIGGNISSSLYGYSQNYQYLYGNDVVITEAEKSCLQGCTFKYRNIVAIGSNNLSEAQAKLILQLQPKRIIMALDEGLEFKQIKKNLDLLKSLATMRQVELYYWDSTLDLDIPSKASPTDMGAEKFNEIMQEQLVEYT